VRSNQGTRTSWRRVGTLHRSTFAALVSGLACAALGLAQAPRAGAFIHSAEAIEVNLGVWQQTLSKMTFDTSTLLSRSLAGDRDTCLESIASAHGEIARLQKKPALGMQFLLLSDLASLDSALVNLSDALELARTMEPPGRESATVKQDREKVASIRAELQSFYTELSSPMFHQIYAADQASHPEGREFSHQLGEISGHIYRADTGRPLSDVSVTLESPQVPKGDKVQRTAGDGSYEFGGLKPGNYWVIGYKSGFAGSVYGLDGSQNVSRGLISLAVGQKRGSVDLHLSPVPHIAVLNNKAVAAAIPGQDLRFVYRPGAFSPDGKLFAFGLADTEPAQVCQYDLASRAVKCVSGPSGQSPMQGSAIHYLAWPGHTLYAETGYWGGPRFFTVTAAGMQPLLTMMSVGPFGPPPRAALEAFSREHNCAAGAGVVHLVAMNTHFMVTAENVNDVTFQLSMQTRDGEDPYRIATGGRELYGFVFDPDRSVVFYPIPGRYDGAVVAFDLNTRRSRRAVLPFSDGLRLLDEKREPGQTIVAYTVDGPCLPKETASGEDPWILPGKALPAPPPSHLCFARVPFGREN
jgi:hypothetical protein